MTSKIISKTNIYEKDKEIYRLWIEYLKESEPYRIICNKLRKDYVLTEQEFAKYDELSQMMGPKEMGYSDYVSFLENHYYKYFLDIHVLDFDIIWANMCDRFKHSDRNKFIIPLNNEILGMIMQNFAEALKDISIQQNGSISIDDVCDLVVQFFGENDYGIFVFVQKRQKKELLIARFLDIINDLKTEIQICKYDERLETNSCGRPTPVLMRGTAELKTYLEVYRQRNNNIKWKNIINAMRPSYIDKNGHVTEDGRTVFLGYYRKAKKIIKNVEQGLFPGKY